ncbi:MAG TPA: hypothetical protein V6D35_12845, partial [Candidatus Sericytochromatia bacterium]
MLQKLLARHDPAKTKLFQVAIAVGIVLLFALGESSVSANIAQLKQVRISRRFADRCLNKAKLSPDARHTVETLLRKAGTINCDRANLFFSTLTVLDLTG